MVGTLSGTGITFTLTGLADARGDLGFGWACTAPRPGKFAIAVRFGGRDARQALLVHADIAQHDLRGRLDNEIDLAGRDRGVGSWRFPRSR